MPEEYGSLPFDEQIQFFRDKVDLPTRSWTDLWQSQHDHGFVVAGAMKRDLVADLRGAVDKAIADGTTLQQFRKDFREIVRRHGWTGWAGEGSRAGEAWRARVIYDTNLRQSYHAGRYAQMKAVSNRRPYWRYRHSSASEDPREQHLAWDGLVLRHDDPWWDTHAPQNGWGCKCYIETLAERDLRRMGRSGPDQAPPIEWREVTVGANGPAPRTVQVPEGIDPGFAYQPGRSWVEASTPPAIGSEELLASTTAAAAGDDMPEARTAPAERIMDEGLHEQDYIDAFLAEFGVSGTDAQTVFEDVAGEPLLISDALFRERSGELKVTKRGRAPYVRLMADTIRLPDEIWEDWAEYKGRHFLRRRYVARWIAQGSDVPIVSVFETGTAGWIGVTGLQADDRDYLDKAARRGTRVYRRGE